MNTNSLRVSLASTFHHFVSSSTGLPSLQDKPHTMTPPLTNYVQQHPPHLPSSLPSHARSNPFLEAVQTSLKTQPCLLLVTGRDQYPRLLKAPVGHLPCTWPLLPGEHPAFPHNLRFPIDSRCISHLSTIVVPNPTPLCAWKLQPLLPSKSTVLSEPTEFCCASHQHSQGVVLLAD